FLLSPDQIATYFADNDSPWEYYWIELNGIQMKKIIASMGISYDNPIYHSNSYHTFKKTEFAFREFLEKSIDADDLFILSQSYYILSILLSNSKNKKPLDVNTHSKLTNEVIEYITNNYSSISSAQDVVYEFKLSSNHLADLFKKEYGMTLNRFI